MHLTKLYLFLSREIYQQYALMLPLMYIYLMSLDFVFISVRIHVICSLIGQICSIYTISIFLSLHMCVGRNIYRWTHINLVRIYLQHRMIVSTFINVVLSVMIQKEYTLYICIQVYVPSPSSHGSIIVLFYFLLRGGLSLCVYIYTLCMHLKLNFVFFQWDFMLTMALIR